MIIKFGNKVVSSTGKWVIKGNVTPPDPDQQVGYWIHKTTGVRTEFGLSDSSISSGVFSNPLFKTNASEIRLPDGVTSLGANALSGAPDLKTLIIPKTVTSIGNGILSNCTGFKNLYCYAQSAPSLISLGTNVGSYDLQIKVEASSYDSYRLASGWSTYYNKLFVLNDLIPGSRIHSGYTVRTTPMVLNNPNNLIIENICFDSDFYKHTYSIIIWGGQNIIIRNCKFRGMGRLRSIHVTGATNVVIYNCVFENVNMGIRLEQCTGPARVFSNDFINIRGFIDGGPILGGACQITYASGSDVRVQDNIYQGQVGESAIEDVYNLYSCAFSDSNYMINRNNWIREGGPGDTSGGALIGDDDGQIKSKNAIIENNIFVQPGQYGLSIAGGTNGIIRNNKVYTPKRPWTNVGIIGINWAGGKSTGTVIENNQIKWTNRQGNDAPYWVHETVQPIGGWETNNFNAPINENILPAKIATLFPKESNTTVKGWWENTSFSKELITLNSSFISSGVFTRPSWYLNALRVFVPSGVTSLNNSFNGSTSLKELTLPDSLTTIGDNSLNGTILNELEIPQNVTNIGANNLNVKHLIFKSSVPPTISSTQNLTTVQTITVPDGSLSAYQSVFSPLGKSSSVRQRNYDNGYWIATNGQSFPITLDHEFIWGRMMVAPAPEGKPSIREVKIPGGIKYVVGNFLLNATGLQKVILPDTVQSIGGAAFKGCTALTSINIPHGVKTITQELIRGCTSLTSITIPSTVDYIGASAFFDLGAITVRFLSTTPPSCDVNLDFFNSLSNKTIRVPAGSVNAYKTAPRWSNYASIIVAD